MQTFQDVFHREFFQLRDKHVRALTWLLLSPSLLDERSPMWHRQIAHLSLPERSTLKRWLFELDAHPTPLHEVVNLHESLRLGHYAENLLAYFFQHEGILFGRSLQVNDRASHTIGEFDFLLYGHSGLIHLELATKFYLFQLPGHTMHRPSVFDYLGPGLNDSLGTKMQKILGKQLTLSMHPAAQKAVPQGVSASKALVKGWLFYRATEREVNLVQGIAHGHCMGFWWTLDELKKLAIPNAMVLERLDWLAPAQCDPTDAMRKDLLIEMLERHFHIDQRPVLVTIMRRNGDLMQEFCRGFVVPSDWPMKASQVERLVPNAQTQS